MSSTASRKPIASIILCAGKGRRMQAPRTPKVCFPIVGKAAIVHMLERLSVLGVSPNILVVGHLAGMVVDEVGPKFPDVLFTYQASLLGTGNATKQGVAALRQTCFDGAVLVIAGDKVVEPRALEKLIRTFENEQADMALIVAPKDRWPEAGRVITDEKGCPVCIMEQADLRKAQSEGRMLRVGTERERTAQEVEDSIEWVNQAIYLYRSDALFNALEDLGQDNAQQEEYLTDTIAHIARRGGRVVPVPVDDPNDVLGFNSPPELLEIEEHFQKKLGLEVRDTAPLSPQIARAPEEWANLLGNPDGAVRRMLCCIYGRNPALCEEKRKRLHDAVRLFIERHGPGGEVVVIRAPGRVNLMGRHVDHRGGCVNLMAIDREHILVARRRGDTTVRAFNAEADKFDGLEFTMDDLLRKVRLDDWREFVNSDAVLKIVRDLQGDWGNYLKAPMLRLQQEFKDRKIFGLDCVVSGDIPMAAGLSSSSALVVAMAEALAITNRLNVTPADMVDLCGEGEWFVGTRGGSADHAAIKLSQFGQVAHAGFFPFSIKGHVPFPSGYSLVICNSRVQARKAAGARDAFNERVASYELAVHLVRKRFPNYAPLIGHLRDICPTGLGIRAADVYRILLDIPEMCTPDQLRAELGRDLFERVAAMHRPPEAYALRARLLFGIAECERGAHCFRLLKQGEMDKFGWMMNISHDGDRVVSRDGNPFSIPVGDDLVRERIEDLQSEDPERVLAGQLYAQPGSYACSTPEIDSMVDIALATPGVLGAQLSGAGLGGCMMVLAREDAADSVIERMNSLYYEPRGLEPGAMSFVPIAGCSPLTLPGG